MAYGGGRVYLFPGSRGKGAEAGAPETTRGRRRERGSPAHKHRHPSHGSQRHPRVLPRPLVWRVEGGVVFAVRRGDPALTSGGWAGVRKDGKLMRPQRRVLRRGVWASFLPLQRRPCPRLSPDRIPRSPGSDPRTRGSLNLRVLFSPFPIPRVAGPRPHGLIRKRSPTAPHRFVLGGAGPPPCARASASEAVREGQRSEAPLRVEAAGEGSGLLERWSGSPGAPGSLSRGPAQVSRVGGVLPRPRHEQGAPSRRAEVRSRRCHLPAAGDEWPLRLGPHEPRALTSREPRLCRIPAGFQLSPNRRAGQAGSPFHLFLPSRSASAPPPPAFLSGGGLHPLSWRSLRGDGYGPDVRSRRCSLPKLFLRPQKRTDGARDTHPPPAEPGNVTDIPRDLH